MITASQSTSQRLGITSFLLAFQLGSSIFEVATFNRVVSLTKAKRTTENTDTATAVGDDSTKKKRFRLSDKYLVFFRQFVVPVLLGFFATIFIPTITATRNQNRAELQSFGTQSQLPCNITVDADIGGDGIRFSIWAQEGVILFIVFLGSIHTSATGVKEVGAGIFITHVALAIALLVQMGRGTLTPADAILGSIILDSQNNALSIQFLSKETLASRWQVRITVAGQLLGLVLVPILVTKFVHGDFAPADGDCACVTVFWWAWLSNCPGLPSREAVIFWLYYAVKCLFVFQSEGSALFNSRKFHEAEKYRDTPLEGITYPFSTETTLKIDAATEAPTTAISLRPARPLSAYDKYPSTVSFTFVVYGVFSFGSMAAAEGARRDSGFHPSSDVVSVGQMIGVVVAAVTIIRSFYFFAQMFRPGKGGFVWPFSTSRAVQIMGLGRSNEYFLAPSFDHRPDTVTLGSIVADPAHIDPPVARFDDIPSGRNITQLHIENLAVLNRRTGKRRNFWWRSSVSGKDRLGLLPPNVARIEILRFRPTEEDLFRVLRNPDVSNSLAHDVVYMITGIIIATRVHNVQFEEEHAPGLEIELNQMGSRNQATRDLDQFVLAYSLLRIRRKLGHFECKSVSNGADFRL